MSIIDPLPHHVSPFDGAVSPGPGVVLGVRLGVAVGVVGVGVEIVGLGLGGGDFVGRMVGVADVLTVADGVTDGRCDFVGVTGGLLVAGLVLVGRTVGCLVAGLDLIDRFFRLVSARPVRQSWTTSAPSPTAAAHPATAAAITVVLRRPCRLVEVRTVLAEPRPAPTRTRSGAGTGPVRSPPATRPPVRLAIPPDR